MYLYNGLVSVSRETNRIGDQVTSPPPHPQPNNDNVKDYFEKHLLTMSRTISLAISRLRDTCKSSNMRG